MSFMYAGDETICSECARPIESGDMVHEPEDGVIVHEGCL